MTIRKIAGIKKIHQSELYAISDGSPDSVAAEQTRASSSTAAFLLPRERRRADDMIVAFEWLHCTCRRPRWSRSRPAAFVQVPRSSRLAAHRRKSSGGAQGEELLRATRRRAGAGWLAARRGRPRQDTLQLKQAADGQFGEQILRGWIHRMVEHQEQDYTPHIRRPGFLSNYPAGRHGQNQKGEQQLMSKIYFVWGIKPSTKHKRKHPDLPPPQQRLPSPLATARRGRRGGRSRRSGRSGVGVQQVVSVRDGGIVRSGRREEKNEPVRWHYDHNMRFSGRVKR